MWQAHASYLGETNLKDWNTLLQNQLKQKPIFSTSLSLFSHAFQNQLKPNSMKTSC